MESAPNAISSIKLAFQDKIFRLSEIPKSLQDLELAFKKFFSHLPQKNYQICCINLNNEDLLIDTNDKYEKCIESFKSYKAKAIKFFIAEKILASNKSKISSKNGSISLEKETFDSELHIQNCFCSDCSEVIENAIENIMVCEKCRKISNNLNSFKELKKFTKSLSPPSNDNPLIPYRKKSHTCTFEENKDDNVSCLRPNTSKFGDYQVKIINSKEKQFIFNNLRKNEFFELKINFLNSGVKKWPKNIQIFCVSGTLEGQAIDVKSLEIEENFEIKIMIKAPNDSGAFHLAWRLGYQIGGKIKYFGPRIVNDIYVSEI